MFWMKRCWHAPSVSRPEGIVSALTEVSDAAGSRLADTRSDCSRLTANQIVPGQKSASRKHGSAERWSEADLLEPRFWGV